MNAAYYVYTAIRLVGGAGDGGGWIIGQPYGVEGK
jgi:hypothetical protein